MAVNKVVSIEVGTLLTRVCYMDYGKKSNHVYNSFTFPTPENTVEDAYIRDRETFSGALKLELKKNKISCKNFVFTISSIKILSREVLIPATKDSLIAGIIESEKKEYFPMDISEHILTYTILEHLKEENQLRLMVYAAPTNLIKNYQNLADTVGCKLVSLDYTGNSVYQWMKHRPEGEVNYFLQINEQNAMFTIMERNILSLQRNINFGTDMLMDVIRVCKEDLELAPDKAWEYLEKGEFSEKEKEKLDDIVKSLVGNVSRVLEFYTTKNKSSVVDKITVAGKGAMLGYIINQLQEELGIPAEAFLKITDAGMKKNELTSSIVPCIGAAYPSVNFLNTLTEFKEKETFSLSFCVTLLILSILGGAAVVVMGIMNYNTALDERDNLNTQINSLSDIEVIYDKYISTQTAFNEITAMHASTYNPNENLNTLIEELENKLPSNILIKSFSSNANEITMSLSATSKEEATKTLMQLKTVSSFLLISTGGILDSLDEATGIREVTFSVTCYYTPQILSN